MEKIILGIETSCDETSAAVAVGSKDEIKILSNVVSSQIDIHKKYGGVVPEVASRAHVEVILPVISEALKKAKKSLKEIDEIAVTSSPGLVGSLSVGLSCAKALSFVLSKNCLFVNHLEGHIYANFIKNRNTKKKNKIEFPAIVLVVSGGHTQLLLMKKHGDYKLLGQTKDDAAGEAFDKVARVLNLSYPGGPSIESISKLGNEDRYIFPSYGIEGRTGRDEDGFVIKILPNLDFSFSGLKTSVLYEARKKKKLTKKEKADMAASFQKTIVDVLVKKTIWAAQRNSVKSILLSGGVSANKRLRLLLKKEAEKEGFKFFVPDISLSTDNKKDQFNLYR
ncbi:tRNA (adenosine(37)-N6)-threonylcarbamoyltransferase complex transferase subunit TsaD [bacterium]|nr:tRNA (adenosine(37)-N6)-threonylcarbamoyltransferase complex transferase subunit TsaD [bacterium]